MGALAALAAVGAYAVVGAGELRGPVSLLAGLAAAALVVGVVARWGPLVQAALSLLVGAYALFLAARDEVDLAAPLVAASVLVAGELAYTALEPPARRTWPLTAAAAVGATVVAAVLLAAAAVAVGGAVGLVAGVAAAAGAIAVVARLAQPRARA